MIDAHAVAINGDDCGYLGERFVAYEFGFLALVFDTCRHFEFARRTRLVALMCHRGIKSRLINTDAAFARDVGGEVERKTVGVVEHEGGFTVQHFRAVDEFGFQNLHAVF